MNAPTSSRLPFGPISSSSARCAFGHPLAHRLPCTLQSAVHGRRCGVEDDFGGRNSNTSRRINTARWLAGRCWRAATKASPRFRAPGTGPPDRHPRPQWHLRPLAKFEPDRTGHRVPQAVLAPPRRAVIGREDPTRSARDQPQAGVRRDSVQPRAHRAPTLEGTQSSPGAEQRLLQGVLRVLDRAEHPVAMRQELASVGEHQPLEGRLLATTGRAKQLPFGLRVHRCLDTATGPGAVLPEASRMALSWTLLTTEAVKGKRERSAYGGQQGAAS